MAIYLNNPQRHALSRLSTNDAMDTLLTPGNITFGLGLLAILFSVYNYFRIPQIDSDKKDALLSQQIQWLVEGTERRFKEIQESFNGLLLQSNNHIHTVDTKVEALGLQMVAMSNEITKLATIIDERIPKK